MAQHANKRMQENIQMNVFLGYHDFLPQYQKEVWRIAYNNVASSLEILTS